MLKLTTLAAIARQHGVPFEVQFTSHASFAWVGGRPHEWVGTAFYKATVANGAKWRLHDSGMRLTLESLT